MKNKNKEVLHKCVICKVRNARSETAKTCDQICAGKLAWETRLS